MDNDPKMASKPAQVKEKIVMGKLNKYYEEKLPYVDGVHSRRPVPGQR